MSVNYVPFASALPDSVSFPGRRCMRLRRRQGYPKKRCRADPKVEAVATCTAAPVQGDS